MVCKNCKEEMHSISGVITTCPHCNTLYSDKKLLPHVLPKNIIFEKNQSQLKFINEPSDFKKSIGYLFCIFFIFLLLIFILGLISIVVDISSKGVNIDGIFQLIIIAFIMFLSSFFYIYLTLLIAFNKAVIKGEHGRISYEHTPLPTFHKKIEHVKLRKVWSQKWSTRKGRKYYKVCAISEEGETIQFFTTLSGKEEASFIEQELEDYCKIAEKS